MLYSKSKEEANLTQTATSIPSSTHVVVGGPSVTFPIQAHETNEELDKLLWDVEDIAATRVEADDDDDIIEVGDDDQSRWTLDQIISVFAEEKLWLIQATFGVAQEITL